VTAEPDLARPPTDNGEAARIFSAGKLITAQRLRILQCDRKSGFVVAHVTSSDGGTVYRTARHEGRWTCGCTARQFGPLRPC
jgi:hypothetical protein